MNDETSRRFRRLPHRVLPPLGTSLDSARTSPPEALRDELDRLLEEALPDEATETPAPIVSPPLTVTLPDPGPPPGHRNAIGCPQCDRWTWRYTRDCRHCGFDLFAHYEHREREREAQHRSHVRHRMAAWATGLGGIGIMLLMFMSKMPDSWHPIMLWTGLFSLCGAWLCTKSMEDLNP